MSDIELERTLIKTDIIQAQQAALLARGIDNFQIRKISDAILEKFKNDKKYLTITESGKLPAIPREEIVKACGIENLGPIKRAGIIVQPGDGTYWDSIATVFLYGEKREDCITISYQNKVSISCSLTADCLKDWEAIRKMQ